MRSRGVRFLEQPPSGDGDGAGAGARRTWVLAGYDKCVEKVMHRLRANPEQRQRGSAVAERRGATGSADDWEETMRNIEPIRDWRSQPDVPNFHLDFSLKSSSSSPESEGRPRKREGLQMNGNMRRNKSF